MNGSAKVDKEVTSVVTIYEPVPEDELDPTAPPDETKKMPHYVAVGWDRTLHIWPDIRNEDESINVIRDLPKELSGDNSHKVDIMSCIYDFKTNLIFTGSHDGELRAWHFETGFSKYKLSDKDKSCMSKDYVKDAKSVDCLVIMHQERILMSGSCDGKIRFWDLNDLSGDCLLYTF